VIMMQIVGIIGILVGSVILSYCSLKVGIGLTNLEYYVINKFNKVGRK